MVNFDLVGVEPTCSRWFRCVWENYSDLSQGHPQKYGSARGTLPKCPRNSGLRITVICHRICLLLLIYCTFFLKVQIWIHHSTQPPAPCSSFATTSCHNTNEPPRRFQQEPVYPDSDWQQRMLEDELPLELPVGARRRELGRFWEFLVLLMEHGKFWVCVQPWQRIYMAFFHEHFKGTPPLIPPPHQEIRPY